NKLNKKEEVSLTYIRFVCQENYDEIGVEYGKLYSEVLMVLQYIIPLTVLVFSYMSIAIVIWCHRIPGEAENSRDRRIARSKRKIHLLEIDLPKLYEDAHLQMSHIIERRWCL
ncbi:hypothetical protein HHI36_012327, partial [Cryptolaemus montrouzieri]